MLKVYFAGETYNIHGIATFQEFYIIRGSIQSVVLMGYDVVGQRFE